MNSRERIGRRPVEGDLSNPYPAWLIGIKPPYRASKLLPVGRADRGYRRSVGDRLALEVAQHNTTLQQINHQEEVHFVGPFESLQTNLRNPGIREAEFRTAIGDFMNENATGENARGALNILVINDNAATQDIHDIEVPFEIGEYGNIDFLGPLYDENAQRLCKMAYGDDHNFSEITWDNLLPGSNKKKKGYDLVLVYNDNPNRNIAHYPHLGTGTIANTLIELLNDDGRIIVSAVPSNDRLRAAFEEREESADLDIRRYEDPLFVNMADPSVAYIPSPDGDNEHRAVLSIGRDLKAGLTYERPLGLDTGEPNIVASPPSTEPSTIRARLATLPVIGDYVRLSRSRQLIIGGAFVGIAASAAASIVAATSSSGGPSCPDGTRILTPTSESPGTTVFSLGGKQVTVTIAGGRETVDTPDWPAPISASVQPWNIPLTDLPEKFDVYPEADGNVLGCVVPVKPAESTPSEPTSNTPNTGTK